MLNARPRGYVSVWAVVATEAIHSRSRSRRGSDSLRRRATPIGAARGSASNPVQEIGSALRAAPLSAIANDEVRCAEPVCCTERRPRAVGPATRTARPWSDLCRICARNDAKDSPRNPGARKLRRSEGIPPHPR
jgi:hypothetical protein